MGKPDTRRLDKAIQQTERMLQAVRNQEMWPLEGHERRAILRAVAGGAYSLHRGNGTARADNRIDTVWSSAETRLVTEIAALKTERQRVVTEHAQAKAAKKSSGWW
ncbi:hypothetical protein FB563_3011 [Streptomyces puniciscabiei]|uniref:Uncharacterized protein n=1 Tax=Streptomyces puniciscabiei TaxID=164348 RepID=A0A542UG12_9ACTN|nr:hypothetical protein [Streptomyces puniciscabiei]TQK98007.1 hypothetical protein FB563_3011 [Streptomyces puniciscabiei]